MWPERGRSGSAARGALRRRGGRNVSVERRKQLGSARPDSGNSCTIPFHDITAQEETSFSRFSLQLWGKRSNPRGVGTRYWVQADESSWYKMARKLSANRSPDSHSAAAPLVTPCGVTHCRDSRLSAVWSQFSLNWVCYPTDSIYLHLIPGHSNGNGIQNAVGYILHIKYGLMVFIWGEMFLNSSCIIEKYFASETTLFA